MAETFRKLTEQRCREVAESLARDYGPDVTTSEVCERIYETDPRGYDADEYPHIESVERIQELVAGAEVVVRFKDDEHPAIESVLVYYGEFDGLAVIEILTTDKAGDPPDIRVYVNDGQVYGRDPGYIFDPNNPDLYPFKLSNEQIKED